MPDDRFVLLSCFIAHRLLTERPADALDHTGLACTSSADDDVQIVVDSMNRLTGAKFIFGKKPDDLEQ